MESVKRTGDNVFHRDFNKHYPIITHGEGIYLFDDTGKRYLDASSGAIAANLGHGVSEIAEAMADQAKRAAFVHTLRFETEVLHQLAYEIAQLAPSTLNRVYFTSGGSEANESAMKLTRQYHRDRGNKEKHLVIGRWQSYHGNTIGSLTVGGDVKRRQPYTPSLPKSAHVHSSYCLRCPYQKKLEECERQHRYTCVEQIEQLILEIGSEFVSAFICEPIVGSQQGAVVPPLDYLKQVRELCDRYDMLLIIDEVMTGFGRTGRHFAVEEFGIEPDILTFGKGVSGGYAPLAGLIASDRVVDSLIQHGQGRFIHGFTFSGHPVSVAAGLAAVRMYNRDHLLDNCQQQGERLWNGLHQLQQKHLTMGQIRGRGLLIGFELLRNRENDEVFPPTSGKLTLSASDRLNQIAIELGIVLYPGTGTRDGLHGDHILLGPPLTITAEEVDELLNLLDQALTVFEQEINN